MSGYLLTETAKDELREIVRYVAERDGQGRAEHVLAHLLDGCDRLAAMPGMGYRRERLSGRNLRWWPVFRYLILYDPDSEPLNVLRILHSARDLERALRQES